VVSILLTYLLVSMATLMYAGDDDTGLGLADADIMTMVFMLIWRVRRRPYSAARRCAATLRR
jgi:hypothetical protein